MGGRFGIARPREMRVPIPEPLPPDITTGDRFVNAANQFIKSATVEIPAGMLDTIAIVQHFLDDEERKSGNDPNLKRFAARRMANKMREVAQKLFPTDERLQADFLSSVLPAALGTGVSFLAGGYGTQALKLGKYAPLVYAGITGAMMEAPRSFEDAVRHGAPRDKQLFSFMTGLGWGMTEMVGIGGIIGRVNRRVLSMTGGRISFRKVLLDAALREGPEEAFQEAIQQVGPNLVAKALYDEDRELLEGMWDNAAAGGTAGVVLGVLMTALVGGKARFRQGRQAKAQREAAMTHLEQDIEGQAPPPVPTPTTPEPVVPPGTLATGPFGAYPGGLPSGEAPTEPNARRQWVYEHLRLSKAAREHALARLQQILPGIDDRASVDILKARTSLEEEGAVKDVLAGLLRDTPGATEDDIRVVMSNQNVERIMDHIARLKDSEIPMVARGLTPTRGEPVLVRPEPAEAPPPVTEPPAKPPPAPPAPPEVPPTPVGVATPPEVPPPTEPPLTPEAAERQAEQRVLEEVPPAVKPPTEKPKAVPPTKKVTPVAPVTEPPKKEPKKKPPAVVKVKKPAVKPPAKKEAKPTVKPPVAKVVQKGKAETIVTAGEEYSATYEVIEDASEIQPSHSAFTFQKNPKATPNLQERPYHTDKSEQAKVVQNAQKFDPRFVLNPSPDAINGAPILFSDTDDIAGGNSRAMTIQRIAKGEGKAGAYEAYTDLLIQNMKAGLYGEGMGAKQVAQVEKLIKEGKRPVLVRRLPNVKASQTEAATKTVREFNLPLTQALGKEAGAVSRAKNLTAAGMTQITEAFAVAADDQTINQALRNAGIQKKVMDVLRGEKIITDQELNRYVSSKTGALNDDGLKLVENLLAASVIDDPDLLASGPRAPLNKIIKSLKHIAGTVAAGEEWDLRPKLRDGYEALAKAEARGTSVEELGAQTTMFGETGVSPEAVEWAQLLRDVKPRDFKNRMRMYEAEATKGLAGQASFMFADQMSPEDAIEALLGGTEIGKPLAMRPRGRKGEKFALPGNKGLGIVRNRSLKRRIMLADGDHRVVTFNSQEEQRLYDIGAALTRLKAGIGDATDLKIVERSEGAGLLSYAESAFAGVRERARRGEAKKVAAKPTTELPDRDEVQYFSPMEKNYQPPPPGSDQAKEVRGRYEIIKFLEERLNAVIRYGRLPMRKDIPGAFWPKPEMIRLRFGQDVAVAAHELGHFMEKIMFMNKMGRSKLLPKEGRELIRRFRADLLEMAQEHRKPSIHEGWAEFFRFYVTNPSRLESQPQLRDFIDNLLKVHAPEVRNALLTAREDYQRWLNAPASARVLSEISFDPKKDRELSWHRWYSNFFDDMHPIRVIVDEMNEMEMGRRIQAREAEIERARVQREPLPEKLTRRKLRKELTAKNDPYVMYRLLRGWRGKADYFIDHGTLHFDLPVDIKLGIRGKGLKEILAPVWGRRKDFTVYAVARRANELRKRGLEGAWDAETIKQAHKEQDNQVFRTAFDELQVYFTHLLEYVQASGGLSPEQLAIIKKMNQEYIPFHRLLEGEEGGPSYSLGLHKTANLSAPLKRIGSSKRALIDPLESIVKNTYMLISWAERNHAARFLANFATTKHGMGRYFEKVTRKKVPIRVGVGEVLKKSEFGGIIVKAMEEAELDDILEDMEKEVVAIFRPKIWERGGNLINIWENGKLVLYQVHPDLYRAMMGTEREMATALGRVMRWPASTLRAGATLTWSFMLRNPGRDQVSALMNTRYGYAPVIDLIRGIYNAVGRTELYWDFKAAGASYSSLVSLDRKYLQGGKQGGVRYHMRTPVRHLGFLALNPIEALRAMSELGEQATRIGEFRKGLIKEAGLKGTLMGVKRGPGQPAVGRAAAGAAAYSAREVTLDFQRIGAKVTAWNQIAAFWNAGLQGLDRTPRAWKARPFYYTMAVISGITLPSLLLYWVNHDDERYKALPQWVKDLYWVILTEKTVYLIPKPFEMGIIFGTYPERLARYVLEDDPHAFDGLISTTVRALPNPIPTAVLPLIENIANYSFFFERPLVPRGEQELEPWMQYGAYTSEMAKGVGRGLNISPRKIENLVRAYTGGLGTSVMRAPDVLLRKEGPKPARTFLETVLPMAVINPWTMQAAPIERFYNRYEEARTAKNTHTRMHKLGQFAEAKTFMAVKSNRDKIARLKYYRKVAQRLQALRERYRRTGQSQILSAQKKRERMDQLAKQAIRIGEVASKK